MKWFQGARGIVSIVVTGFAMFGCVTGNNDRQESSTVLSPSEQSDGQATTVTAEGLVKHEKDCVPVAEKDRLQPPSVELGVSRDLTAAGTVARPYTRYNCR